MSILEYVPRVSAVHLPRPSTARVASRQWRARAAAEREGHTRERDTRVREDMREEHKRESGRERDI